MDKGRSFRVAFGGLVGALALFTLFLTGMVPLATYVLPAAASVLMISIVVECGRKWALLVYLTISMLALFITPDREAAVMFIFFFGYYPILKSWIERLHKLILEWLIKLFVFNASMVIGYLVILYVLGIPEILTGLGDFGKYSIAIILGIGNVTFLMFDFLLTRLVGLYITWFRVKFLRRL